VKRIFFQVIILVLLAVSCYGGFLIINHILQLPFRSTNDTLHRTESVFALDFLIPNGKYIDNTDTIGEVIKFRFRGEKSFFEKMFRTVADLIPQKYRYVADLLLFLFYSFCFMALFRVFTFMRYGRTLRISLLFGGIIYYFVPDFSPGKREDLVFVGLPLFIVLLRMYILRRRRKEAENALIPKSENISESLLNESELSQNENN
jgi:hypothetical protein